jgi:hypothetical protein
VLLYAYNEEGLLIYVYIISASPSGTTAPYKTRVQRNNNPNTAYRDHRSSPLQQSKLQAQTLKL